MDTMDEVRQHLSTEKDKFKQKILENLTELYFLRNNGLMCDFQQWATKEAHTRPISEITDEDIISDQKFSQLLNLQFNKTTATTTTTTTATTTTTTTQSSLQQQTKSSTPSVIETTSINNTSFTAITTTPTTPAAAATITTATASSNTSHQSADSKLNSATSPTITLSKLPTTTTIAVTATTTSTSSSSPTVATTTTSTDTSTTTPLVLTIPATTTATSTISSPFSSSIATSHVNTAFSTSNLASSRIPSVTNSEQTHKAPTIASSKTSPPLPRSTNSQTSESGSKDGSKRKRGDSPTPDETVIKKVSTLDDTSSPPLEKKLLEEFSASKDDSISKSDQVNDIRLEQKINDVQNSSKEPEVIILDQKNDHRTSSNFSKKESPTRISKVVEPIVTPTAISAENHQKQIFERAKHEAAVTARITELRKQGLWSAKRLPKLQEPPRPKTHWDYLLEEMRWLSSDFDAERKWKRKAAKKCALMVYRYHQEKRSKTERAEREHLQHIKKLAASQAKEIRSFWSSIEKIVDFRQQTKLEETRKKAMGLHLNYILDQTSKFSNTCLGDIQKETKEIESDYLINQDGENAEKKEPVINNDEQTKSKHEVDDIAAGAESIQPKGNTLETTTVSTKVPFLLKHNLREYQHIGLDWLVAMYNKKLNGILADEMGLGKTIQTIALLAHLACEKGDWGPHLIVVPTSVMLNWEMEFKKWCPAFKILTYYGNPKERKMKRVGWLKPNRFHVCITSYRIVIQDHAAFRRRKWCYFILDEAHYIKNFKSQRWQMLLNFNSQRRLLLTGTPLQNDLMELWSLMHFLMPNLFDSYREFKDWFVNPLTGMIEGSNEYNQELVQRLHKILRPFLLRRLKADVEKQLPSKVEHVETCRLSKRQRFLYEEFMSLSKTKETIASGSFLSVINVLMQLRKVCNHPNLFEPRPTISPFMMSSIAYKVPGIVTTPLDYSFEESINLANLQLLLVNVGLSLTSLACDYIKNKKVSQSKIIEVLESDDMSDTISIRDNTSSVVEVDPAMEAIESSDLLCACESMKDIQSAEKKRRLKLMSEINEIRCEKSQSIYFRDLQDILDINRLEQMINSDEKYNVFSNGNGRILCSLTSHLKDKPAKQFDHLTRLLDESIKSPRDVVRNLAEIIDRFVFCVPGVSAPPINMHVSHCSPSKKVQEVFFQQALYEDLSPRFDFLNKIMVNMRTSFPELRLIEYDCGKLQTLSRLLNELKSNDHRVLIFTQMSRMLDILEQFLNYHGHTYLRLDGATKIDQRQIMMERFNNDRKIFCFILSTRSGGIGVNLTGADTVIFYDSDWNPTMDAQAQDRCHRIGQTRDVHIYRLISEQTIETNIFMKAQQKRLLCDLAIEEGKFNTSPGLKRQAIQELFNLESSNESSKALTKVENEIEVDIHTDEFSKAQLNNLEQALTKGEVEAGEEMDVDAIKVARDDVDTDLREFDENIPITEESSPVEKSEKEQQIDSIVSQMTPVEQYAVKFLESLQKPKNREELEQAEKEYRQELENKKSQWEQSRIEMLKEQSFKNDTNETMLTYPNGAKCEHVQYLLDGERTVEEMPLWAPPTPPTSPPSPIEESSQYHYQPSMTPAMAARINAMGGLGNIFGFGSDSNKQDVKHFIDEKDLYVDYTAHFLYEPNIMLESQLPPVNQQYTESEYTNYTIGSKKIRLTGTPVAPSGYFQTSSQLPHLQQHLQNLTNIPTTPDGTSAVIGGQITARKPKVRRDEVICLPKSIFDRQTPNFAKIRRELKLQKLRCVTKGNDSDSFAMQKFFHSFSLNPLGQSLQQETIVNTVNRQMQQFNNPNILLAYHQDQLPPWTIQEEWALLMVIQHLQDLPVNLCILTPGHTPNWELVSEVISDIGFTHRSYKMCEYHFACHVQKLEMSRDSSWEERALQSNSSAETSQPPSKKSKKHKNQQSSEGQSSQQSTSTKSLSSTPTIPFKPSKTGAMLSHDKSLPVSFCERYDIIKRIRQNKPKLYSRVRYGARGELMVNNNPTTLVREDKRMIEYDRPLKPEIVIMELAEERKRRALARAAAAAQAGHLLQPPQHSTWIKTYPNL